MAAESRVLVPEETLERDDCSPSSRSALPDSRVARGNLRRRHRRPPIASGARLLNSASPYVIVKGLDDVRTAQRYLHVVSDPGTVEPEK